MMAQTSLMAYHSLDPCKLAATQSEIYRTIARNPHMSNRDISRFLRREINTVTPRTNELIQMGLVERGARKIDELTGRSVYTYRVVQQEAL